MDHLSFVRTGIWDFKQPFELALNGNNAQELGQTPPQNIYAIYGISTITNGVTPVTNNPLIAPGQDQNLYLKLVMKDVDVWEDYRLDQLVFDRESPTRMLLTNLPGDLDFSRSQIINPTGINNVSVLIYFHYLPIPGTSYAGPPVNILDKYEHMGQRRVPVSPDVRRRQVGDACQTAAGEVGTWVIDAEGYWACRTERRV